MEQIRKDLEDIIEKKRIYSVYQPIVSLSDGEIFGYEALSRIDKSNAIDNPEELFRIAEVYQRVWEVDSLCRKKAIAGLTSQTDCFEKKLFLNVNPLVLADQEFRSGYTQRCLEEHGLSPSQVVIEITEQSAVKDMQDFSRAISHYVSQSYEIAIDDVGSCYSGLNLICDVKPKYLKIDRQLIHDVDKDNVKYAMIKSLVEFARLVSIRLIAEGIETEKELSILVKLGVPYGQGYFLAKPEKELGGIKKEAAKMLCKETDTIGKPGEIETEAYRVLIFSLENMKAKKGIIKKYGEEKIVELTSELENMIQRNLEEGEIIKYLTENDLLVIVQRTRAEMIMATIHTQFGKILEQLYDEKEIENEMIKAVNKKGEEKKYPVIKLRIEEIVS